MSRWQVNIIQIARPEETRRLWRWVLFPPLGVVRECLRDRLCSSCHGTVSPFLFIGKLPDGPYMAFRHPIQFVKKGTIGLVLIPGQIQGSAPVPAPAPASPPAPVQPGTQVAKVASPTGKRVKKTAKRRTGKPTAPPPKKPTGRKTKPAPKKPAKKTPGRRRSS